MIVVSGHVNSHGQYLLVGRDAALLVAVKVIVVAEEESSSARAVTQFT